MNTQNEKKFLDYLEAVLAAPPGGQPSVVIGGQAVNFWCEYTASANPELQEHRPFTSKDLDLVAESNRQILSVAEVSGLKVVEANDFYAGANRAALIDKEGNTLIQFLTGVYGLQMSVFQQSVKQMVLEHPITQKRYQVRIIALQPLLKGKLRLAISSDNIRSPMDKRRDINHIKLLIACEKGVILRLLEQVKEQASTERDIIDELKSFVELSISEKNAIDSLHHKDISVSMYKAIPHKLFTVAPQFSKLEHYLKSPQFEKWCPHYLRLNQSQGPSQSQSSRMGF